MLQHGLTPKHREQGPARFELGALTVTAGAAEALADAGLSSLELLTRYQRGDWGDTWPEDQEENQRALAHGEQLFARYKLPAGGEVWVLTAPDRGRTGMLLPHEYREHWEA